MPLLSTYHEYHFWIICDHHEVMRVNVARTYETWFVEERHWAAWSDLGLIDASLSSSSWFVSCDCAEVECQDLNTLCGEWRDAGECENNAPYMNLYCQLSCNMCGEEGIGNYLTNAQWSS